MEESTTVKKRGLSPAMIALIALALIALVLLAVSMIRGSENQDRLSEDQATAEGGGQDPEQRCASARTYDLIKRELFRRAGAVRGSDQATYDRLTAYDEKLQPQPMLAESWDLSTDAKQIKFNLRKGVQYHSGRELTSADVEYNIRRV